MKKILLIDDKVDIQEILADFLRNRGYHVEACANGKQALAKARDKKYDLVITDLLMPDQNGFSFMEEFRKLASERITKTPIVVITGGSPDQKFQSDLDSIDKYGYQILKKPFTKEEFLQAVKAAFKTKAA